MSLLRDLLEEIEFRLWLLKRDRFDARLGVLRKKVVTSRRLTLKCGDYELNKRQYGIAHGTWNGYAYLPFLQTRCMIKVIVNAPDPTPDQLAMLESIVTETQDFSETLSESIVHHYYSKVAPNQKRPNRTTGDVMSKLSRRPEIVLGDELSPTPDRFVIRYGCQWDDEHGLSVVVKDWRILSIGH